MTDLLESLRLAEAFFAEKPQLLEVVRPFLREALNRWPEADEEAMKEDEIDIPVQINGKTKAVIGITVSESKDQVLAKAKEALGNKLTGNVIKEIYVPGKIVNIVAK